MNKDGLKIEPGMILVFTPACILSHQATETAQRVLEDEARKALGIDNTVPLPVGIVIVRSGDKLDLLKAKERTTS